MQHQQKYDIEKDMRYLQLLSQTFPNIAAAATEIINLSAIPIFLRELNISLLTSTVKTRLFSMS